MYEPVVVFVAATTGQGDEPDNMKVSLAKPDRFFRNRFSRCSEKSGLATRD